MPGAKPLIFADPEEVEDLLHDLEAAFEIRFVQGDVDKLHTVGDLHDLLGLKLGTTPGPRQRCLSAVSFYRLKQAVALTHGVRIAPRTMIADIFPAKTLPSAMAAVEGQLGLKLPSVPLCREQYLLLAFGAVAGAVALYSGLGTGMGAISLLVALGCLCILRLAKFPRALPQATFGDLARETAFLNFGRLAREAGTRSDTDLWQALDFMIRRLSPSTGKIERDTRLT